MEDHIGQQLGNYRLVELLGVGTLTKVYLGEHIYLNTLAAIKVLDTSLDSRSIFWFKREAGAIATLVHPNIIRVLEFDVVRGATVAFLVVTYAPHGTFPRSYPKGSCLPPVIILPYVKQLCSALQYAHNIHFIHRDIRPERILLGDNNEVLLDFGSSLLKGLSSQEQLFSSIAADINVYWAPEQIMGRPRVATDQYALGVMIYEWLCGKPPFGGNLREIVSEPPPPLRETMPTISPAIEQVILKALAKDPHQRFSSIEGFANAFEHACLLEQATPATSTKLQSVSPSPASLEESASTKGMKLFFSYSHKDEKLRNELAKRLALLKRTGLITDWYDRDIDAGAEWAREIDTHLNHADIILLLVSPDFIASDYCYNLEMMRALERHQAWEASVIPIILRPVSWKETPFGKLQALPEGGKAVTTWSNRDEAFLHITEGIRKVVEKLSEKN